MKKVNLPRQIILLTITLQSLLTSCCYYKVISTPLKNNIEKAAKIDSLKKADRTFILRNGNDAFLMETLTSNTNQNTIECTLGTLSSDNQFHLANGRNGNMRYRKNNTPDHFLLNEVHVYIVPDNTIVAGRYNLSLDEIQQIEVIEKDKLRTTTSYIAGGLGIAAGVMAIIAVVGAEGIHMDMSSLRLGGP